MMDSREREGESEHDSLRQPMEMGLIRVESTFWEIVEDKIK